jgi:hypothetical protein
MAETPAYLQVLEHLPKDSYFNPLSSQRGEKGQGKRGKRKLLAISI